MQDGGRLSCLSGIDPIFEGVWLCLFRDSKLVDDMTLPGVVPFVFLHGWSCFLVLRGEGGREKRF